MTTELTMLLMVVDSLNEGMPQYCLYIYRWHNTIHQAIGVYMHWVILRMKLEYQALVYIHLTQL